MRLLLTPYYAKADEPVEAAATADSVAYELTVTNTGLLALFNISVVAGGDVSGVPRALTCTDVDGERKYNSEGSPLTPTNASLRVEGLASYPGSGLKGGSSITCAFSSAVAQTEVRFGLSLSVKRPTSSHKATFSTVRG